MISHDSASEKPDVARVTVDEVKERLDRGEPILFLDTRAAKAWDSSDVKIRGAMRVPPDDVERHLEEIPRDRSIVTYCTWTSEASSARAAQTLLSHGFKDVHALHGGFDAWREANGAVEPKSTRPRDEERPEAR